MVEAAAAEMPVNQKGSNEAFDVNLIFVNKLARQRGPHVLARSASLSAQWELRHVRSDNAGCIELSDAWCVKVRSGYAGPTTATPPGLVVEILYIFSYSAFGVFGR